MATTRKTTTTIKDLVPLGNNAWVRATEVAGWWPAVMQWRIPATPGLYDLPGEGVARTVILLKTGLKAPSSYSPERLRAILHPKG